jgi:hypothetical protein
VLSFGAALMPVTQTRAQSPRDGVCRVVRGSIEPSCDGTVCTRGSLVGDLHGRFTSRVTSIYPAGSGWIYTAWTRIELDDKEGRIETLNYATTPFDPRGGPDLSQTTEILSLSEATGTYEEYSGMIVISGAHPIGRPTAYIGRLCRRTAPP